MTARCPNCGCKLATVVELHPLYSPDDARREANKLMAQPAYTNRDHPEHAAIVEKVQRMFEIAYQNEGT